MSSNYLSQANSAFRPSAVGNPRNYIGFCGRRPLKTADRLRTAGWS